MNESSPTVLACLFLAALVAVESPGRALDLLTETQMRVTTYTRQMHAPLALLRRAFFFCFFVYSATQRESAQVASLLERNHCNALEAVVGSTWLGGG